MKRFNLAVTAFATCCAAAHAQTDFVNWENPQVHPLDVTPDGLTLLAVNTADDRLELFDITTDTPAHLASVPVGIDPVTVRARSNTHAWVVNHISDSISIVDLTTQNVVATLDTDDEPTDVVFTDTPARAFVTCSQVNRVLVFDLTDLSLAPTVIDIAGEDPRALAVSADQSQVYVAIFESGNTTTILGGGADANNTIAFPPNVVSNPAGPYGGTNPPPNDGGQFNPTQNPDNPPPPAVGLIVRKNADGQWRDDNNGDWTEFVTGLSANLSGRPIGWDLLDHDVAVIDTTTFNVTYATGLMNICMSLAVNPADDSVTVIGTDATNQIRYEPNLSGRFIRDELATFDPADPSSAAVLDLNPHLDYTTSTIPQLMRDLSIGDPRAIVWNNDGTRAYVAGMGSNNVIVIDQAANRAGAAAPIDVGEGPTGLALLDDRHRLFVLNRFDASLSVIDTAANAELTRVPLFDPTPQAIKIGRKHLYDTHENSGLGNIACASCHVDARMDRLAWDLGDPSGQIKTFNQNCNFNAGPVIGAPPCEDWHPMKGPMMTQTFQDIIGKEPHHWRGDRNGLEEFNPAFQSLLGNDTQLTPQEMQEFEDFLATITFPPNPFRNFDNSLPTDLPLPGQFTTGRFGPAGQPLPNGNAETGLLRYRTGFLDANGVHCVTCHTLPAGIGTNFRLLGLSFAPFPIGPNGERHHAVVSVDGSTNVSLKIPQLRNLYEKVGFEATQTANRAGFGFIHDGSVDSLARFVSEPVFTVTSDQEVADLVAFLLSLSGSDLPGGSTNPTQLRPPGPSSQDTHAAVGVQVTFNDTNRDDPDLVALLDNMSTLANQNRVGLVAKGIRDGLHRGYVYTGSGQFQSDRQSETVTLGELRTGAAAGAEITFTLVPSGTQQRIGIDRDRDGRYDRDELDNCGNPADPADGDADYPCDDGLPCTFDRCADGGCVNTVALFGDVASSGGACGPDGDVNIFDIFAVLDAFQGLYVAPCTINNLDIAGADSQCAPDGGVTIFDILAVLDAFQSATTCCE